MVLAVMVLWSKCVLASRWYAMSAFSASPFANDSAAPDLEVAVVRELGLLLEHLFAANQKDMSVFIDSNETGVRASLVHVHSAVWCISAGHQNYSRWRRQAVGKPGECGGGQVTATSIDSPTLLSPNEIGKFIKVVGN